MNLAELFTRTAAQQPDSTALRLDETVLTYGDLDEATAQVAALLGVPEDSVRWRLRRARERLRTQVDPLT